MRTLLLVLLACLPCWAQSPVIDSLSPDHVLAGSSDITLTVHGSHFASGSNVIVFNGASLSTTMVSSHVLTATVASTRIAAISTVPVFVGNSVDSNTVGFRVLTPLASIASYAPTVFTSGDTPIVVRGSDFASNATILFDWQQITTTFVSPEELTGTVPGTLIASSTSTTHHILVYNAPFTAASVTTLESLPVITSDQPTIALSNVPIGTSLTGTATIRSLQGTVTLANPFQSIAGPDSGDFSTTGGSCANGKVLPANSSCSALITVTPSSFPTPPPNWIANNSYMLGDEIVDNANSILNATPHVQKVTTAGTSGANVPGGLGAPAWNESGGTTAEGPDTLVWTDQGPYSVSVTETATLSVNSNASNDPQSVPLTATKTLAPTGSANLTTSSAQLNPSGYDFGSVVESSPTSRTVTLQNAGGGYMNLATPFYVISGADAADFSLSAGTCADGQFLNNGNGISTGGSCTFDLTFTPSTTSVETATFTLNWSSIGGSSGSYAQVLTGTGATATSHISLAWTASNSSSVTGYKVYRGLHSGGPYTLLTSLGLVSSYDDSAVSHGNTYCYVLTATGPNPPYTAESIDSNEACATF